MKKTKNLFISLLVLVLAGGFGWGTYTLAGPSSSAEGEHAGHGHEEEQLKGDPHGHADAHAAHDDHGDEAEEELEGLFSADAPSREAHHEEDDDHHGEDHSDHPSSRATAPRTNDPHAGHGHGDAGDEICPEHNIAEAEDALCQPDLVSHLQPGEGLKVRLAAPETAGRIGITTAAPLPVGEEGAAWPGQVAFNRDRLARLSALAGGAVRKVHAGLGERVAEGQALAEIAAPEAAGLRAELSAAESRRGLAEAVYRREKDLLEKGITSRHEFQQAEAEFHQAESAVVRIRRQMHDFGLVDGARGAGLPIRAPFAGTVIERTAVVGETVAPGTPLFVLADLSTVWVETSVPEEEQLSVRPGMEIVASFSGLPGRAFTGEIFWVAPALDEQTRMLKVLAQVDNGEGLLRSGLFGQVRPAAKTAGGTLAVPADAVQTVDGNPFVFVRLEEDLFELRRVTTGRRIRGAVTIQSGLQADDRVAMSQSFSLKSEVLRARLGASCADH
ncbi:efflux RND transporter periplasmic adaptor subunit [Desulfuromonas sp. TF]|uniref:efflux RND transporter periplasmic adaptor subunit n=1 Tax=Desulfuromonas sp. TF TaxID=1232410 RepID=UPI0004079CE1|nr:efflux RND transporter periplasmic adaptor subunit [Desulfuromonas sp. TF]